MTGGAWLEALHFLRPQWLWGLLALPLLAWAWQRRHAARNPWRGTIDAHLLPHLLEDAPRARARRLLPLLGALLAAALALLALAGPTWQRSEQPLWQVRTPLLIALDLSGSMLAADLPPSRLAQARAKLATLLAQRTGGEVGLLVYAGDAYVVAPLTADAANVALFLDALSPGIMPGDTDADSRADRAIAQARQRLQQAGFDHGDILLLDDHADAQAITAARAAAADGYTVSVLGLGSPEGAPWRDSSGAIRQSRLDARSLQALAAAGGGRYAALSRDTSDLEALGVLDPRQAGATAGESREQALIWRDQGYWLLLPLLLLVALGFRRGSVFAVLAACMLLPWQPAQAADVTDWWQRPDQQAHARMEAGAEAYQQGAFDKALGQWSGLPGADAAYNRGNALARQGQYPEAIAAYDEALRLDPGMADAIANRQAVQQAMQRPPAGSGKQDKPSGKPDESGGQQGEPQPGSKGQGAQPPGQQAPDSQRPDADGKPQAGHEGGQARPGAAAKPDAAEQQAADAAQRKRMEQALQQQDGAGDTTSEERPGETPQQREQRLASEAWLRRVPDDPGGLLRARLLLEYQRRQEQRK